MNHDESIIQSNIVKTLSSMGLFVFAVGNDNAGKCNPKKMMRLISMGLRPGVPDLVVLSPDSKAYFLEVKTATGRLSESQKRFQAHGFPMAVVRSVDDAVTACKKWGLVVS